MASQFDPSDSFFTVGGAANDSASTYESSDRDRRARNNAAASLPLPRLYGNYELLEEIARGGMGVVFKARQLEPRRLVALKMIVGGEFASPALIERFQVTARAAAALDHPGIVPIYDIGTIDAQPFLTMPLVAGDNLHQWVSRLQPNLPSPEAASRILIQVCEAVQYAHERDPEIVHRDLKPQNILLPTAEGIAWTYAADPDGPATAGPGRDEFHPRLTDFGLARVADRGSDLTARGERVGTPGYMAAEQAAGDLDRIGRRTDVYGLGAVLYFLLTGRPPFQSASTEETLRQVREEEPLAPRRLNPSVPKDLETICLKCLAKKPEGRYGSALALADDLRRFLAGESIRARPIGVVARNWRWAKRHPGRAGLAAAALASAVGLFLWQHAEQRLERHQQQAELDRVRQEEEARRSGEVLQRISTEAGQVRDQVGTGRFDEALAALERLLPEARLDPRHAAVAADLESLRTQAADLKEFYRLAEKAWYRASDDDRSGRKAIAESHKALQRLGILTRGGDFIDAAWWPGLARFGVYGAERERLVDEVYGQIVLIALLHMREGLTPLSAGPNSAPAALDRSGVSCFEQALAFIARARAWERTNSQTYRTTRLMELISYRLLATAGGSVKGLPTPEPLPPRADPRSLPAVDHFLDGLLHYYLGQAPDLPLIQLIKFFLDSEQIDAVEPLKRAEDSLRAAARTQPDRFLPHFILGWTLMAQKDFAGAELAFNTCVRLRPEEPRGYLWRSLALVERGARLKGTPAGRQLTAAGLADHDTAAALQAGLPGQRWKSAEIFFAAEQTARALEACTRALEADDGLLLRRVTHRVDLKKMDDFVTRIIQAEPDYAEAHAVRATLRLRVDAAAAAEAAAACLRLKPDHPRALTVRGVVALTTGKDPAAALADFRAAAIAAPSAYHPVAGIALAHEAAGDMAAAARTYQLLVAATPPADWQLVEACMGLCRTLLAVGDVDGAEAARARAYDTDPGAAHYLDRHPPFATPPR